MFTRWLRRLRRARRGQRAEGRPRSVGADGEDPLPYEQGKALARNPDPEVRLGLAVRGDLRPELLYYLAGDADARVRRAIAANVATPRHADLLLARDADEAVRLDLAHKIGRLAPGLHPEELDRLEQRTLKVLEILARDVVPAVRRAIAEEVKALDTVPKALAEALARDAEFAVAVPLLEFSPLLDDELLLEVIRSEPVQGALGAISRRGGLGAAVADAIAEAGDEGAIAALLANPTAQIREETLDRLVEEAPVHEPWHEALVLRPQLSGRAVERLSRFVANSLLSSLVERHSLSGAVSEEVLRRVEARLASEAPAGDPAAEARELHRQGRIDEALIRGRLDDRPFLVHALALAAGLSPAAVGRVLASHSPEAVTALAWKAGLGMETAVDLQIRLARLDPEAVLQPKERGYPLSPAELDWRLALYED